jgi:adenylosuccinate synthase
MNIALQVERSPEDAVAATTAVEGELREFVRRDLTTSRKFRLDTFGDSAASEVATLISRMAGASVTKIDKLLDELQSVRDYLQAEGERVEREAARYAQVSQTALASVRIITDSMGQWKGATGERRDTD